MYTNVRQTEAINCVCNALERTNHQYAINKPHSSYIRTLLELIIGRNCFQFGNKYFLQKVGCAMGSTASPEICDITLHDLENRILQQADNILTWWRYRDDILIIYGGNIEEFKNLVNTMNQMHPTLKFTFEASNCSVNYLDLTIFKGNRFRETGILDTKVYTKPTETYQYLHKSSSHPPHVFNAFIYGETLRFARNTNNIEDFQEKVETFTNKLTARGYTHDEINTQIQKVSHHERANMIHKPLEVHQQKNKSPLVFTTTYNPALFHKDISRAITKHWPLIHSDETLTEIFPNTPFIAFKKYKNIREKIIRAKLPPDTTESESDIDDPSPENNSPELQETLEDLIALL